MPSILYEIIDLLASILRLLGLAVFGLAFGWLGLDLLKKSTLWMVQVAVYLGLAGLLIALTVFTAWVQLVPSLPASVWRSSCGVCRASRRKRKNNQIGIHPARSRMNFIS